MGHPVSDSLVAPVPPPLLAVAVRVPQPDERDAAAHLGRPNLHHLRDGQGKASWIAFQMIGCVLLYSLRT